MSVVLLDFDVTDRRERGRMVEISLVFIQAGAVSFPAVLASFGSAVTSAASALGVASTSDLGTSLAKLSSIPAQATQPLTQFAGMATTAVNDAGRVFNAVRGLSGYFGRFATGSRSTLLTGITTAQGALAMATTLRTQVTSAASALTALVRLP
jgi:hypothetical protein